MASSVSLTPCCAQAGERPGAHLEAHASQIETRDARDLHEHVDGVVHVVGEAGALPDFAVVREV